MFGAATLIIAISARAALLPTVSIMCAALSVSRRACSIMMRASAMRSCVTRLLATRLAEGDARCGAAAHHLERAFGEADQAHAVMDAAGPEAALRDLEAAPFAEQHVGRRHAHVLEQHFGGAVGHAVEAEHRQRAQDLDARRVHRHEDHRLLPVAVRIVRIGLAHEDEILQRGSVALDVYHLRPLMT